LSYGANGTITQEIKSALYGTGISPEIYDVIVSLGGKDVFPETLTDIVTNLDRFKGTEEPIWID
jgi:pyruvate/2-oxoacid:ferredoxin oxidoreductase alpha subunit